jgi:MFS family permease
MIHKGAEPGRLLTTRSSEFAAGWGVLVASGVGFGLGLSGIPFYTMGAFVEPLHAAFGWPAASIQGGLTVEMFANIFTLPAAAWLADRYGARPVALGSVFLFALSFMFMGALNSSLPLYYLHWALVSAAGAGTLTVVWAKGVASWFRRARGAALGLAMMGTGVAGVFSPVLANALIDRLGWRETYVALGLMPLLISLPLVFLLFRVRVAGDPGEPARIPALAGPFAARNWRFWVIGLSFLLVGASVAGLIPNLIRLLRSHSYSSGQAAGVASLVGLFVIFGRAACGALLDRIWASAVAAMFFVLAGAACLLLRAPHLGSVTVAFAAAAIGLAAGAEFDVLPYLTSRYFGVQRLGSTLGLLSGFFYFGAAMGPFGFGRLAELAGGYDAPLLVTAAFFMTGSLGLLLLGRYPAAHADATAH